jgi:hypothetical protein
MIDIVHFLENKKICNSFIDYNDTTPPSVQLW